MRKPASVDSKQVICATTVRSMAGS